MTVPLPANMGGAAGPPRPGPGLRVGLGGGGVDGDVATGAPMGGRSSGGHVFATPPGSRGSGRTGDGEIGDGGPRSAAPASAAAASAGLTPMVPPARSRLGEGGRTAAAKGSMASRNAATVAKRSSGAAPWRGGRRRPSSGAIAGHEIREPARCGR